MQENNSNHATRILYIIAGALAIIAGLAFLVNGLQALLSINGVLSVDEVISASATILMGVVFFVGGTESLFSYFRAKASKFQVYLPIVVLGLQAIVWTIHFILLSVDQAQSGLVTARNNLIFLLVFGFAGIFFSVMSWRQKEGVFKTVLALIGLVIAGVAFLVGFPHFVDTATVVGYIFGVQVFILMFIACLLAVIFRKKEEGQEKLEEQLEEPEEK